MRCRLMGLVVAIHVAMQEDNIYLKIAPAHMRLQTVSIGGTTVVVLSFPPSSLLIVVLPSSEWYSCRTACTVSSKEHMFPRTLINFREIMHMSIHTWTDHFMRNREMLYVKLEGD